MDCINFNEFKLAKKSVKRNKCESNAENFFSNAYYSSNNKRQN